MRSSELLFTPGPLNTCQEVRDAMQVDYGSRGQQFVSISQRVRRRLGTIAGIDGTFEVVPIQGSGTFALEAMLGSLVGFNDKALVLSNGAYGDRIASIGTKLGLAMLVERFDETTCVSPAVLSQRLAADHDITHICVVHCETTTGIMNPLREIADVARTMNRALLVDAIASFGGVELSASELSVTAMAGSSNKCLEGVPGLAFVVVKRDALHRLGGNPHSVCLDLQDQLRQFDASGQWRFTPPTHSIVALDAALDRLEAEGGVTKRSQRHRRIRDLIIQGFSDLGYKLLISVDALGTTIVTFRVPAWEGFDVNSFFSYLSSRGVALYPGKISAADTFRVGCIGMLSENDVDRMLEAVRQYTGSVRDGICK